jgi:hypothetical protein
MAAVHDIATGGELVVEHGFKTSQGAVALREPGSEDPGRRVKAG